MRPITFGHLPPNPHIWFLLMQIGVAAKQSQSRNSSVLSRRGWAQTDAQMRLFVSEWGWVAQLVSWCRSPASGDSLEHRLAYSLAAGPDGVSGRRRRGTVPVSGLGMCLPHLPGHSGCSETLGGLLSARSHSWSGGCGWIGTTDLWADVSIKWAAGGPNAAWGLLGSGAGTVWHSSIFSRPGHSLQSDPAQLPKTTGL